MSPITKFLAIFIIACPLFAFPAKVIKISDGDTITVLSGKEQTKVRLYGIDAPEKKQDYGQKSRQFLASLIAGQVVEVEPKGKDRYKRTLGIVQQRARYKRSNGTKWLCLGLCKILENICRSRENSS